MFKIAWHRIQQNTTVSGFKKFISSAKINDEKVAAKVLEGETGNRSWGYNVLCRVQNLRKCENYVFAWEQLRGNTLLLLYWKKSNWNVCEILQTLETWHNIPNNLTLNFDQTPLSTAGHTLHIKWGKECSTSLEWDKEADNQGSCHYKVC